MKLSAEVLHNVGTRCNVDLNHDPITTSLYLSMTTSVEPVAKLRRQLKYFLVNNVILIGVASMVSYVNTQYS